jgi:hypothetical protein
MRRLTGILAFGGAVAVLFLVCYFASSRPDTTEEHRRTFQRSLRETPAGSVTPQPERIVGDRTLENIRLIRASAAKPQYRLFDKEGLLTYQAILNLNLTPEDVNIVQGLISDLMKALRGLVAQNAIKSNSEGSDVEGDTLTILPFESDLKGHFDDLGASLSKVFGPERAGVILASVPADKLFGSFGLNKVVIHRKDYTIGDGEMQHALQMFEILEIDPKSGRVVASRGGTELDFKSEYPGVFDSNMNTVDSGKVSQ